jgi:tetratricopeptide (TPR) repeat protein
MDCGYRGAFCTGLLVCTLAAHSLPAFCAEINSSTNNASHARDDKSAAFTFALQAVQQLQTQQRATLQAVEAARQQAEATSLRYEQRVESLRYLLFAFGAALVMVTIGAVLYVRFLLNRLRHHGQSPISFKVPFAATPHAQDNTLRATALLVRGQVLLEQGHPFDALTYFEQAVVLDAPTANAFIKKGAALERLGRLDEALASYEQALALDAAHADAYIGKGNVLNRLERYQEALACFERAADYQHAVHALPLGAHAAQ